jgi:hypothetical protein
VLLLLQNFGISSQTDSPNFYRNYKLKLRLPQEPDVLGKFLTQIRTQRTKIKQEPLIFFKRQKLVHYLLGSD